MARYLTLIKAVSEKYGNPIVFTSLPSKVEVNGKKYRKTSIIRYTNWVKLYYGNSVIQERRVKMGNTSIRMIYVDPKKVEEELGKTKGNGKQEGNKGTVEKTAKEIVSSVKKIIEKDPKELEKCLTSSTPSIYCDLLRVVLDKSITEYDGVTLCEIVMGNLSDEYIDLVEKSKKRLEKRISRSLKVSN